MNKKRAQSLQIPTAVPWAEQGRVWRTARPLPFPKEYARIMQTLRRRYSKSVGGNQVVLGDGQSLCLGFLAS